MDISRRNLFKRVVSVAAAAPLVASGLVKFEPTAPQVEYKHKKTSVSFTHTKYSELSEWFEEYQRSLLRSNELRTYSAYAGPRV